MSIPRFIQVHTLHSYTAALLNRDDSGLAKRLPYGGAMRTRISSQCLKRHWRIAEDPHAMHRIDGAKLAYRSRELVRQAVFLDESGQPIAGEEMLAAIEPSFQKAIYGDKGEKRDSRQTLILGEPEIDWLRNEARRLIRDAQGDSAAAKKAAEEWGKEKDFKSNIKVMREQSALPGGLTSALFGRMVTSDTAANIDAPVYVAHAFTTHTEETESDYFTAVDDLKRDDSDAGADTIQETELTSGIYYGYVAIDLPGLVGNLTGAKAEDWLQADRALAAEVVHNLIYLIAEVSPGAKRGSTAPFGRAELVLVEAGDRQPRQLSGAFREPSKPTTADATRKFAAHLALMDLNYETGEARRSLHFANEELPNAPRGSLREIAEWTRKSVLAGEAS